MNLEKGKSLQSVQVPQVSKQSELLAAEEILSMI